jgi:hypothetical protein
MKQIKDLSTEEKGRMAAGARGVKSDVFENPTWRAFVAEAEATEPDETPKVVRRNLRD